MTNCYPAIIYPSKYYLLQFLEDWKTTHKNYIKDEAFLILETELKSYIYDPWFTLSLNFCKTGIEIKTFNIIEEYGFYWDGSPEEGSEFCSFLYAQLKVLENSMIYN